MMALKPSSRTMESPVNALSSTPFRASRKARYWHCCLARKLKKCEKPVPDSKSQEANPLYHWGKLQHIAATLRGFRWSHTSLPPLTVGKSRRESSLSKWYLSSRCLNPSNQLSPPNSTDLLLPPPPRLQPLPLWRNRDVIHQHSFLFCLHPLDPPSIVKLKEPERRHDTCIEFTVRGSPHPTLHWFYKDKVWQIICHCMRFFVFLFIHLVIL